MKEDVCPLDMERRWAIVVVSAVAITNLKEVNERLHYYFRTIDQLLQSNHHKTIGTLLQELHQIVERINVLQRPSFVN